MINYVWVFSLISVPSLRVQDTWLELAARVHSTDAQGGCL